MTVLSVGLPVGAGVLVAAAVLLARPRGGAPTAPTPPAPGGSVHPGRVPAWTGRAAGAVGVALATGLMLGGDVGTLAAIGAGPAAWLWLGRLEAPTTRRRRARIEADLPHAVDLLAACLAGGQALEPAVDQVARAVPGPVGDELGLIVVRLRLGVDPVTVWRGLGRDPALGALGRSLERASDSGAPVAGAIARLAEDLRAESRSRAEARARSVGVRAAVPLGVCLLPAFLLLGVVPLVAASLGSVLGP